MHHPVQILEMGKKNGVYCLASDGVIEWFQMFARSLRHWHPEMPLTVIPYNRDVARIKSLAPQFHFDVISEAEAARFESLETTVMQMNRHAGMFRKWAAFFGRYDEFIFLDADIALTAPLDRIFSAFAKSDFDFVYFDTDLSVVYRPEWIAEMQAKHHSVGFNAGAFMSRKRAISEELLWKTAEAAARDRHKFEPLQVDQPFLNYVCDTLPLRAAHVHALLPELALKPWARVPFRFDAASGRMLDSDGLQMPFVHWAGCGYPAMVRPEIFLKYRTLGMNFSEAARCRLKFYYRRFRARMKHAMKTNRLSAGWLARRDERLRQKRLRSSA